jgi:nitroreductase
MGYDTAPMEGFMEDQVKALLKVPERVRVVAMLAIGRLKGKDKPYAGRFQPTRSVFAETWGKGIEF